MKFGNVIEYNMRNSFVKFVFTVCQVKDYRNILKLTCRSLAFTLYKAFQKQKEVWN